MRLADFIVANTEPILAEWEAYARQLPHGSQVPRETLRDHLGLILRATASYMDSAQSRDEGDRKARGGGGGGAESAGSERLDDASELHGKERVSLGFNIVELVAEYRALRACVIRLWREQCSPDEARDIEDVTRFHESVDQSIARAVGSYSERVDASRKMFLAMLSHDLRAPVHSISMAAELMLKDGHREEMVAHIRTGTRTINQMIHDLIDFASSGLGGKMPLQAGPVDLEDLCREVVEAYRIAHPHRRVEVRVEGEVDGVWDEDRVRQVVSNLVGNALQHGSAEAPVTVTVSSEGEEVGEGCVVLRVHNEGEPIPEEVMPTLFDPLTRFVMQEQSGGRGTSSIGLGLYIVREIVITSGGEVEVSSSREEGTTFTVRMPRRAGGGGGNLD